MLSNPQIIEDITDIHKRTLQKTREDDLGPTRPYKI